MKLTRKFCNRLMAAALSAALLSLSAAFADIAAPGSGVCLAERDYVREMETRRTLPVQSNSIPNWPQGPAVGAQSAILMEMNTHTILYAKNIHEKNYPASTTKIATALLAMQNCTMEETITFSRSAIYDVPGDGSKLGGVDTGDTMLMETALYCVLVQSANEVANAVGEHVAEKLGRGKSMSAFADLMNEKARELGCKNTHFSNCSGLFAEDHYTSAYDLALFGCEFFSNELLCKMSSTPGYHFRLKAGDEEDTWIASKNQLFKKKPYAYQYLLGSKTGFVSQSRQTLVSAAEKNGMKLVCVVFAEETPYQFEDTIALFQYGFENFQRLSISDNETKYNINTMDFFDTGNDLFGDSTPLISMEDDTYVILPNTAEFSDAAPTLAYADASGSGRDSNVIATISYTYSGVEVGSCDIVFFRSDTPAFSFAAENPDPETQPAPSEEEAADAEGETSVIYINVLKAALQILALAALIVTVLFVLSVIDSYSFSAKGQSSRRRRVRRKESRAERRAGRRKRGRRRRR